MEIGPQPRELRLDSLEFGPLAEAFLREGVAVRFRASGRSMRPFVCDGDLLTAEPVAGRALGGGDIVLCRTALGIVAHRIVAVEARAAPPVYRVRGDASCGAPERVAAAAVMGRVATITRGPRTWRADSCWQRWRGLAWALRQSLRGWWRVSV